MSEPLKAFYDEAMMFFRRAMRFAGEGETHRAITWGAAAHGVFSTLSRTRIAADDEDLEIVESAATFARETAKFVKMTRAEQVRQLSTGRNPRKKRGRT